MLVETIAMHKLICKLPQQMIVQSQQNRFLCREVCYKEVALVMN